MSIRFAAPRSRPLPGRMDDAAARAMCIVPANDNGFPALGDATLHATLRHFAAHGLAAAGTARARAQAARGGGDKDGWLRWLAICRTLDRRMARELDRAANGGA